MIFLGLGSSVGDAEKIFESVEDFLAKNDIDVLQKSKILINPPLGGVAQNEFSNAVWAVDVSANFLGTVVEQAQKLLQICKACEKAHGRNLNAKRWSDRSLDLDILMFDDLVLDTEDLKIPHPEIKNRDFVLLPWAEIVSSDFELPIHGNLHNLSKSVIRR